jgi:hypothetical protein
VRAVKVGVLLRYPLKVCSQGLRTENSPLMVFVHVSPRILTGDVVDGLVPEGAVQDAV